MEPLQLQIYIFLCDHLLKVFFSLLTVNSKGVKISSAFAYHYTLTLSSKGAWHMAGDMPINVLNQRMN